ncbi:hypothetical protein B0T26DRAFT_856563 [Lasiosphaeria miniovina]|uniref:MARVEL domain-containing protein n=1 Tax=Lasiosphaeria miniovina TaxID=1954250 RepID=A0AA40DR45_9PEZI|nr:uncharacterized protein B0T26DRAFT_856563 [Lasiosphaeria miniovina]KAK0712445.1 hypothetical protein B0T26DRAFT_856563 [Lasiosphaeria miniovina]
MEPGEAEDPEDHRIDRRRQRQRQQQAQATCAGTQQQRQRATKSWLTARTVLEGFSALISIALLGLGIKMAASYDTAPLIHVSVAFVGFAAAASIAWPCLEFSTMWLRRDHRGIYPGAHVGVHICLFLASVAVIGYVCLWVSEGDHWKYVVVHGQNMEYSPLYHMGIAAMALAVVLFLIHFILSILACREIRRKDYADETFVTVVVRYDGVGPEGTARPRGYHVSPAAINLPAYAARETSTTSLAPAPAVIPTGDLGRVDVSEEFAVYETRSENPEKPGRSGLR